MCGYRMQSKKSRNYPTWKCLWVKKCGYEAYETFNGTLHWWKNK